MKTHGFDKRTTIVHELYQGNRSFPAWAERLYLKNNP